METAKLFLSIFAVVFVAELPDKTALTALVLATRYRALGVFAGAASALTVQSGVAVGAGRLLALLPARAVHIGAGLVFVVSAIVMWRREDEPPPEVGGGAATNGFAKAFATAFGTVFLAEWGDLTQLATASLAARTRHTLVVFAGAASALTAVAALAVFVGNRARHFLNPKLTRRIAAALFGVVGVALLTGLL